MDALTLINNRWARIGAVGITTAAVGAGVGYILYRRRKNAVVEVSNQPELPFAPEGVAIVREPTRIVFQESLPDRLLDEDEVEEKVLTDYNKISMGDKAPPMEETVDPEDEIDMEDDDFQIEDEPDDSEAEVGEESGEEVQNIFANNGAGWDYEEEKSKRNPSLPYILHQDEYHQNQDGYTQHTLVWYEADDVLVDEADKPVYNHHAVVGDLLFGHGSNDPNVVYIRNCVLKSEYEILKHSGHFAQEILGLEADADIQRELSHHVPKFRPTD